jgi:hypothetical protein
MPGRSERGMRVRERERENQGRQVRQVVLECDSLQVLSGSGQTEQKEELCVDRSLPVY